MSAHSLIESERVRLSFTRRRQRLVSVERRTELALGGGLLAAAGALVLSNGVGGHFSLSLVALYVLGMAVAANLTFDVGVGFTVPSQLMLVPMLFAEPPELAPFLVALALMLALVPAIVRGQVPPSRLLVCLGNSWFAFGPALVLAVAGARLASVSVAVLLLAIVAQLLCDFGASVVRDHLTHRVSIRDLVDETWRVYLIDVSLSSVGLAVAFAAQHRPWAPLLIAPLFGLLSLFSRERRVRLEQLIELNEAYRGTAMVLGDVVEADDSYTGAHTRGVVALSLDVASTLDLDAARRRNVEFGALLHDVGKVAVPKAIINKPGKLDEAEWAIIRCHTIEGQRMLETVGGVMREVGLIVRSSHERWDGGGYPDGLAGTAIPLESRIVSVCDAFNAMTTSRSYRAAMPLSDAAAELRRCAGTQFDPRVVDALLGALDRSA